LVYSNKSAALIMSVVIEEMLHLALSCNVKQAVCQVPPDILGIGKVLSFPTQLDGHEPEFEIDAAKLSLKQLTIFLMIESPKPFTNPHADKQLQATADYKTIGGLYKMIEKCIADNFPGPYKQQPQLLPPEPGAGPRPFYSQNSSNTIHYDREHNPQFANTDDSGGLVGVYNSKSAIEALHRIVEQGEGSTTKQNEKREELAHFAKFLEAYSLGGYYEDKFKKIDGVDDFFSYFVYDQKKNPTQADYDASGNDALALCNKLGSALFAYILLMVETCYYKEESTQYELFMYGIHKSMIWLLSGAGNYINKYTYSIDNQAYNGSLTFEYYPFEKSYARPKAQILELFSELGKVDSYWLESNWGENYFPSLPDVGIDHSIIEDVPKVPSTPYTHNH